MDKYEQKIIDLRKKIKERAPNFEILFKDESTFMKLLGRLLFFNKSFLNSYINTMGEKVYWPSIKKFILSNPFSLFVTLAHEYVHIMDFIANPVRFVLGYLFPQCLAIFSLLAILSIISPWFLLFLLFLVFLLPIPSPFRKNSEIRGYGMSLKVQEWEFKEEIYSTEEILLDKYAEQFTSSAYYFMWPFKDSVVDDLRKWLHRDGCLCDPNPAYRDVYDIIKK